MDRIKVWWGTGKWVVLVLFGGCLLVLGFVVRGLFRRNKDLGTKWMEVPQPLKERIEKAEEDALVAKVHIRAKTHSEKEELESALKLDDGKERRRRLAAMLQKN